ncbi:MAG: gliding motility-associated C-terminal domain-containing protein, partial [Salibacteraceae bacterium]
SINEGCGEAEILFSRGDASDTSITYLLFSGTATNGVDFDTIPDSLVFLPGKFDSTIVITPYADGMNEGIENFIIQAISVTACGDTFISEGALYIYDTAQLDLSGPPDTSFTCPPDSLNLWVTVNSGGPPPYSYLWNNGQTSDSISITLSPNGGIDTFIVAVQDSCMIKTFYDTVLVFKNYEDDPVLEIINDSLVNCEGDSVLLEANVEFGSVPLSYLWSNGDTTSSTLVEVSGTSQIVLFISDACGRIVSDTALLGVKIPNSFEVSFPDTSRFCIGAELFVNPGPKGGIRPYQYSWDANNPQFDDDSTLTIMINQDTTISFWISDACGREFNTAFFVDAFEVDSLSLFLPTEEGSCSGTGFTLKPQLSGGLRPYTYDWSTGDTDSVITFEASVTQTIGLTITDVCGSQIDASGLIEIPEYAPLELAVSGSTELCFGDEYIIKAYARGGAGDYRYTWISLNEPLLGETFEKIDSAEFKVISRFENTHFITVNDYCGNATTDTLNITIDPCVSIPNVITPNGDGINDAFYIESINNFDDARLTVYNRWGQKIFESKPYRNQWVPMNVSSGVYYYILTSNNFPDLRGDLTIINDHE